MSAWLSLPSVGVAKALKLPEEASLYCYRQASTVLDCAVACLRGLDAFDGSPTAHEKGPFSLNA